MTGTTNASKTASLHNVTMTFDRPDGSKTHALHDVSLDLHSGELLVFVGRSGSGKTTALNVLAGLAEPTSGHIEILGTTPAEARVRLGYMFARDALLPWRSALGNVEYGLEIRNVPAGERRVRAKECLKLVGLEDYASNYPGQLSQGQRQRVALARTWVLGPEILFMDEPFAALDAQTREALHLEFLRVWARDRQSVVFVTHDLSEAIAIADRIVVFSQGKIAGKFDVPFERPRDMLELPNQAGAKQLIRNIRELLAE